jgi:hypothetical protein
LSPHAHRTARPWARPPSLSNYLKTGIAAIGVTS